MVRVSLVLGVCLLAVACGKKGPPLAPIVRIPAEVEEITARRVGNNVYVTLTVPDENIDETMPGDVVRIDVYGYTGRVPPPRARFADLGSLITSLPVVPVPPPGTPAPPPDPAAGGIQGMPVTIVEPLTADDLVQGLIEPPLPGRTPAVAPVVPAAPQPLRRFYMAFPFGPRNRPGPPGAVAELPLTEMPLPPTGLAAVDGPGGVTLTWEPVGGLIGFLVESRELPREELPYIEERQPVVPPPVAAPMPAAPGTVAAPGTAGAPGTAAAPPPPAPTTATPPVTVAGLAPLPAGPTRYLVYREVAPDPLVLPASTAAPPPWRATIPTPVSGALTTLTFQEPAEFERERCYTVRSVRGVPPALAESDPAPPVCVRPIDVYPPAPPAAPDTVAAEGAISLIWEPSSDPEVGGYLVLRGVAGDATLTPLTPTPIFEASYRDTTVTPGTRYVYAVQAVDSRVPLGNVSAPSPTVEETAR